MIRCEFQTWNMVQLKKSDMPACEKLSLSPKNLQDFFRGPTRFQPIVAARDTVMTGPCQAWSCRQPSPARRQPDRFQYFL
jgi:hypothetical protein